MRARILVYLVLTLIAAFGIGPVLAAQVEGRVIGVTDGDTLTILTASRERIRIRLAEIDAPENQQPWGRRAKQALSGMVFGKSIKVTTRGKDQYGRTLGKVYVNGENVNAAMVRSGAAWAYREYLTDYSLISAEAQAKRSRQGLWAMPTAQTVAPWEWRQNRQSQQFVGRPTQATAAECGFKRYCRQMSSCEEAYHYLQYCGVSSLDGDGDGRPCEALCRRR
jgi:endonuclease YncB( thermonuclease family)